MKSLDDLRVFDLLARTGHFGRTAAEAHMSPSTLSRRIAALESDLGETLFRRDRRSVVLSPAGIRFRAFVADVLSAWDRFEAGPLPGGGPVAGTVSLFCTVTASQSIVPEMLARFRQRFPQVHLALETGYAADALARLEDGSVDLTVAAIPPRVPRHLLTHVIASTPLVLVATRHHPVSEPIGSEGWPGLPLVLPTTGLARTLVDRWFRRQGIRPSVSAEANGHEAVLALVSLGCGIGVVPELVALQSPLAASLRTLATESLLPSFDIAACTIGERLSKPAVAALWSVLTGP